MTGRDRDEPVDAGRRAVIAWLWRLPVLAVVGGAVYGLYEAINVHFLKRRAARDPDWADVEPVTVASVETFARTWDAVEFAVVTGAAAGVEVPALAVRLPAPVPGGLDARGVNLAAFSRVCTHQHCIVSLNTDVNAINFGFNYATDHPALTCPCHLSVFDARQAGRAVSGPANLPLPRVRLELRGEDVVATGLETV